MYIGLVWHNVSRHILNLTDYWWRWRSLSTLLQRRWQCLRFCAKWIPHCTLGVTHSSSPIIERLSLYSMILCLDQVEILTSQFATSTLHRFQSKNALYKAFCEWQHCQESNPTCRGAAALHRPDYSNGQPPLHSIRYKICVFTLFQAAWLIKSIFGPLQITMSSSMNTLKYFTLRTSH